MSRLPEPGDTWNDRYEITAELGRGGFGRVYRARDRLLERDVAIKMLRLSQDFSPTDHQRFRRETNIAASLDHRHIVTVYDGGERDELLYLVMRFVAGRDLRYELEQGPLAPERAASIVRQVGGALDYAHDKGLVHRDVKPGNILCLDESDAVFLADFGISRRVDQTTDNSVTKGLAPATVAYAAPEQMRTNVRVDGRADQYALGCVLFECLTARKPFDGEIAAMITAHLHEAPPQVTELRPELPAAWNRVISTAMAKDPNDRFERCAKLAHAAAFALPPANHSDDQVAAAVPSFTTATAPVPDRHEPAGDTARPVATDDPAHPAVAVDTVGATPADAAPADATHAPAAGATRPAPSNATRPVPADATRPTAAGTAPRGRVDTAEQPPAHRSTQDGAPPWRPVGIALLALLVVALLAWLAWPVLSSLTAADDATTATDEEPADGSSALDEEQRQLLTDVNVFDPGDCRSSTSTELAGQLTAVACASRDQAPTRVVFRRFASATERDAALNSLAGSADPEGDCETDGRAVHPYRGADGAGRVVCVVADVAGLSWSVPDQPIMGSARIDDPDRERDLYDWWDTLVQRSDS